MVDIIKLLNNSSYKIDIKNKKILSNLNLSEIYDESNVKNDIVIDDIDNLLHYYYNYNYGYSTYHVPSYYTMCSLKIEKKFYISKNLFTYLVVYMNNDFFQKIFGFKDYYLEKSALKYIFSYIVDKFNNLCESKDGYLKYGGGNKIRYGKFLKTILKLIIEYKKLGNKVDIKDYERYINDVLGSNIENEVNKYKSYFNISDYKIALLNGNDIKKGYFTKYQKYVPNTVLKNSCMNNKPELLELYVKNSDKVGLLVLLNKDGKIEGRSLLWKIKKLNNYYLDRVYFNNDSINNIFLDIAKNNMWSYYIKNSHRGNDRNILIYSKDDGYKKLKSNELKIKLNKWGIKKFPYLDTFRYNKFLTNKFSVYYKRFSYCCSTIYGEREFNF